MPLTITADDSVKMNWSVRGQPTLLTHTDTAVNDPDNPQYETREYTLVVQKKGKEVKKTALVNVLPVLSADDIVFTTVRKGDTLVAAGEKNSQRWGTRFVIQTVSSGSRRELTVSHNGRTAQLSQDGSASGLLAGLPNSGDWEITTLLTAAEKADTGSIPGKLRVHSIILYTKR
jgi:hypothetical protein